MKEKTPLSHELVCFEMLGVKSQILNQRSQNQIRGKLLLTRKLLHFRGSRFSQCFCTTNLSPLTRYHVRFYANNYFEVLLIVSTAFNSKKMKECNRHLCMFRFLKEQRNQCISSLVKGTLHVWENNIVNCYWSILRAPRQWPTGHGGNCLSCLREVSGLV